MTDWLTYWLTGGALVEYVVYSVMVVMCVCVCFFFSIAGYDKEAPCTLWMLYLNIHNTVVVSKCLIVYILFFIVVYFLYSTDLLCGFFLFFFIYFLLIGPNVALPSPHHYILLINTGSQSQWYFFYYNGSFWDDYSLFSIPYLYYVIKEQMNAKGLLVITCLNWYRCSLNQTRRCFYIRCCEKKMYLKGNSVGVLFRIIQSCASMNLGHTLTIFHLEKHTRQTMRYREE